MDPIELGSSLECEDGSKVFATAKYDNGIPGTVQYVRIQVADEILPKLITNSANIDHYVLFKNDNQTIKPQKSVPAKPNPPTIIPKSPSQNTNATTTPTKKVKTRRDEMRRFQHNQIERARREKINNWIMELGKIIPESFTNDNNLAVNSSNNSNNNNNNNKSPGEALSKGGILEKACEYIQHLKNTNSELNELLQTHNSTPLSQYQHNKQSLEIKRLLDENEKLKLENAMLKRKLTRLNVDVEDGDIDLGTKKLKADHEPLSCVQFVD